MKGRHLEKRGGQVFILKCFTSLRRFCWLQVNFSQATAYPAVRQVGAIVFQKAVTGQLPQVARSYRSFGRDACILHSLNRGGFRPLPMPKNNYCKYSVNLSHHEQSVAARYF